MGSCIVNGARSMAQGLVLVQWTVYLCGQSAAFGVYYNVLGIGLKGESFV